MDKNRLRRKRLLCAALSAALIANAAPLAAFAAEAPTYADGTYTGTAMGHNGNITVSVTVADSVISAIDVTDQQETPAYWDAAQEIIPQIIAANQTEGVDSVSGATISCDAIKKAVANALADAVIVDSGFFAGGNGSQEKPYLIATAAQLAAFAASVDGGETYRGQFIALDADIDLTGTGNWNPIGAEGAASANLDQIFAGSFDGRGHVIKGLTIKTDADAPYTEETNIGLFSTLSGTAHVSGIQLEDISIDVAGEKVVRAGGITGDITSKAVSGAETRALVDSCTVRGAVSAKTDAAMVMTGGVAGRASGNAVIANCVSDTAVQSASGSKIAYGAGIAAMTGNDTYVLNCANLGDITVTTASGFSLYAGGISGMMTAAQYNCYSLGDVTVGTVAQADAASNAGILAGALMPAGSGAYDYYGAEAAINYVDETGAVTALDAVPQGEGSMHAEGAYTTEAVTAEQRSSGEFAALLNDNLYAVTRALASEDISVSFKQWTLSDAGETVLSDEIFVNDVVDASIFAGGDGTAESPYQIADAAQLRAFAASLSEHIDYTGTYVALSGDIDISDAEWTPVGDSSYVFNGSFDGQGFTVSGMTIGSKEQAKALEQGEIYLGFFSVLGTDAAVKNLHLTDILINASYQASIYAGGIAAVMDSDAEGYQGAVIDGCSAAGDITVTAETGNSFVGGIAAYMYKGAVINCKTDVNASCTVQTGGAYGETGGLAALVNRGLVANSYSLGKVYGSGSRADEGMAVVSALVAVNAGWLVNCYGAGAHETNDYSLYTGAVSGWITGIGHAYDCYYNSEAEMKIGETVVKPVAEVGTRVASGVSEDGLVYTGGVVWQNEGYTAANYSALADKLNANFAEFPAELAQFGLADDALKAWRFDTEVTFAEEAVAAVYVQPEAEIVTQPELTLNDGTWYGRDSEKTVVVTITVKDGEITEIVSSDGSAEGGAYDEALRTAKDKSIYQDKTGYSPADPAKFAGGDGTEQSPYLIQTEAQLRYVAEAMNEDVDWENIWFALDSDITLHGEWLPIGHAIQAEINGGKETFAVYPFRGNFDGRNHTVTGMTIGSEDAPADIYLAGLFGIAAGAHETNVTPTDDERLVHIRNITLKDIAICVNSRYEANVGGLIAWAQNGFVIDSCAVSGTINATARESFGRIGGLVGSALRGVITDCGTDVQIYAATETSSVYAGGLAGMTNRSAQVNCYTRGDICANAESNNKATVGGLTGMSGGTNINCYTFGNVESLITTVDVGGINGRNAGIALDYECWFNADASQKAAGTEKSEKTVSGTLVGEETRSGAKTAAEMASADFAAYLNENKANMSDILKDVSTYLEDMTETNKEGLSHFLFYTDDGSDLNAWVQGEKSPVFSDAEPETADHIASDEELLAWSVHDYELRTGTADTEASLEKAADSSYQITLTDKDGAVLDKYAIDPETGIGENTAGEEVNLPQTGNNAPAELLMLLLAFALAGFGALTLRSSGVLRKKRSETAE